MCNKLHQRNCHNQSQGPTATVRNISMTSCKDTMMRIWNVVVTICDMRANRFKALEHSGVSEKNLYQLQAAHRQQLSTILSQQERTTARVFMLKAVHFLSSYVTKCETQCLSTFGGKLCDTECCLYKIYCSSKTQFCQYKI